MEVLPYSIRRGIDHYSAWCDILRIYAKKVRSKNVSLSPDSCVYKNIFHWTLCVAYALSPLTTDPDLERWCWVVRF
jgi:hypothetical protein